jgi:hypothetical protein
MNGLVTVSPEINAEKPISDSVNIGTMRRGICLEVMITCPVLCFPNPICGRVAREIYPSTKVPTVDK